VTAVDDCFAFPERRLLHEEAIALLRGLVVPVPEQESISLFAATGRVCAEAVKAPRAIPAHTNAAVDGYAFAFEDYDPKEGTVFQISGRAAAGQPSRSARVERGAVRIFTGAVMPDGCDTVAMQEDCRTEGGASVFIPGGLKRGANRRLAGEDVTEGATLLDPGHRLRPQDAAALAASGRRDVTCFRKLRICVFSTGDEVLAPGAPFREGRVYDANGPMLSGLFAALAAEVSFKGILPDSRDDVRDALQAAALDHDLIITSGGASLGEEDHIIAALREGHSLSLWQLAIKPGRPMGVGKIRSCLCFALPGNPVAVMVCALLYVWPAVRRLAGEPWVEPLRLVLPAGFEIRSRKQGRREFFRGWLEDDDGKIIVKKYERDGSGLISSLRAASGLVEIPENQAGLCKGDTVNFIPFSAFGIL
jgi:molybdopterin molybdotransferase